jgi:hypothetical protein
MTGAQHSETVPSSIRRSIEPGNSPIGINMQYAKLSASSFSVLYCYLGSFCESRNQSTCDFHGVTVDSEAESSLRNIIGYRSLRHADIMQPLVTANGKMTN